MADVDEGLSNKYKAQQAFALEGLGEQKGDNDAFDQSLKLYDEVMTYLDGQPNDDQWAEVSTEFGEALFTYGQRRLDDTEYLDDAQHAFEATLKIWSKDKEPVDWARTQNNLGNVLATKGDQAQDPQLWQQAQAAYVAALEVWTEDTQPFEWARAQVNMGTVLRGLGNYGKDAGAAEEGCRGLPGGVAAVDQGEHALQLGRRCRTISATRWAIWASVTKDPKQYAAAVDAFSAALRSRPSSRCRCNGRRCRTISARPISTWARRRRAAQGPTR